MAANMAALWRHNEAHDALSRGRCSSIAPTNARLAGPKTVYRFDDNFIRVKLLMQDEEELLHLILSERRFVVIFAELSNFFRRDRPLQDVIGLG
jgi:hypothetical protein